MCLSIVGNKLAASFPLKYKCVWLKSATNEFSVYLDRIPHRYRPVFGSDSLSYLSSQYLPVRAPMLLQTFLRL